MVDVETERRLTTLETQYETLLEWKEEQKQMQKDREAWHRTQTLTLIGFGVTILVGLLAIYFK